MVPLAQDVGRPRVRTHNRRYPLGAGRSSHANNALALCDETDAGNVIGCGDRSGLSASRWLRTATRPSFTGFPLVKMTKDGTNKDAMTRDAMWKDQAKDDGMAKGATKRMRRRKHPPSSSIGRVE
jgi:hypothetical protein